MLFRKPLLTVSNNLRFVKRVGAQDGWGCRCCEAKACPTNNIALTKPVMKNVLATTANFHALADAEFEAKPTDERRRYIALLAKLAYPNARYLQDLESLQKGQKTPNETPEMRKRAVEIAAQQFPHGSTDQPGFAAVANAIRIDYATAPNAAGPLFAVTIHVIDLQKMDDETMHLPR
jgi:hypothetical protein